MNMKKIKSAPLAGWLVAGVMAATLGVVGFQQSQNKFGIVDMNQVIADSKIGKENTQNLQDAYDKRRILLEYLDSKRVVSAAQADEMRTLELKEALTEAEQTRLEAIRTAIQGQVDKYSELSTKTDPTIQERTLSQELSTYVQTTVTTINRWQQEFEFEMQDMRDAINKDVVEKANAALQEVASKEGYSVVLEKSTAPYAANDITEQTTKQLDDNN
jgi:Skp family chaperone for outer membrane proteins